MVFERIYKLYRKIKHKIKSYKEEEKRRREEYLIYKSFIDSGF